MTEARKDLIEGLNRDLAGELQAIIHYLVGGEMMTGANRPELRDLFRAEIADEVEHARFLAHKIVALGGTPGTEPEEVRLGRTNREQLEIALEAEEATIRRYQERLEQADAVGDLGLRVRLEDLIADETQHKHDLELILQGF